MKDVHPVMVLVHVLKAKKFYFAKFIDWFTDELPEAHQKALLAFIVDQVDNERWERRIDDPFATVELVKSILFHYSGREGIKTEPSVDNLIELIEDYLNSKECLMADAEAKRTPEPEKPAFADMMGELDG